jgi:phosphocarrier protein HPr
MNIFGQKHQPSEVPSVTREFVLSNKLGMHARPAALFVKTASKFSSEIMVEKDGEEVNGKSIMGLMMLAAGCGSILKVNANGTDAAAAIDEIAKIFERKFDEE